MIAEPLADVAARMNKETPGAVDVAALQEVFVANAYTNIIINPNNPVTGLTAAQVAGLMSGEIANWSEVGGADMPVLVVSDPSSSQHSLVEQGYGFTFTPTLRAVPNAVQTATIVAQAPNAISYLSTAHDVPERDMVREVTTEVEIALALYVAAAANPSDAVAAVLAAISAVGGV